MNHYAPGIGVFLLCCFLWSVAGMLTVVVMVFSWQTSDYRVLLLAICVCALVVEQIVALVRS